MRHSALRTITWPLVLLVQNNRPEGPIDLVARSGGKLTAYTYTDKAAVSDHTLLIQFMRGKLEDNMKDDGALCNAIHVVQLAPEAVLAAPPVSNTTVRHPLFGAISDGAPIFCNVLTYQGRTDSSWLNRDVLSD
jgi:hypothetical protein